MTRVECEKKILEKIAEIRAVYEEYVDEMRYSDEEARSLAIHIARPTEESELSTWFGSVVSFTEDADGDIDYILNASAFDGELYEHDTQYTEKGVTI